MKRILTSLVLALTLSGGSAGSYAAAAAEADTEADVVRKFIETSVNRVLGVLTNKKLGAEERKKKAMEEGDRMFDLRLMAKLSLGRRHWPKLKTKARRKEFTDLFVDQLRASYADKVDLLTDEAVEFEEPVKVKKKYQMVAHIIAKDQRYKMLYKIYKKKKKWKVYDVEIEGISIIRSYGSQYHQFLKKKTIEELLTKMREKSLEAPKALEQKRKEILEKKKTAKAKRDTGAASDKKSKGSKTH